MNTSPSPADRATDRRIAGDLQAAVDGGRDGTGRASVEHLHAELARRADRAGLLDVAYRTVDSPIGPLLLAATGEGLVRVAFHLEDHDAVLQRLATDVSPRILRAPPRLDEAARQLGEYFAGSRRAFDLPVDLRLAQGFRRDVLDHLRAIPYGRTESYAEVARASGNPKAVRAAGSACSHNPVPLVVPCHRVVRSDGSIGQYLGGTETKVWLLAMEERGVTGRAGTTAAPLAERVDTLDWTEIATELDDLGCAQTAAVLDPEECRRLVELYDDQERFRSTVDMERYRFGKGQYRYFDHPLPEVVAALRTAFWPHLLPIARAWASRLGRPAPWPDDLDTWLDQCHRAGQTRPTPLLLRYGPGDWNALHRDLYGELVFPLQITVGLDRPGDDYTGGELVLVEQRPRAQSRATTTVLGQGRVLVFTTRDRPVQGARGWSASPMRHGVSVVRAGRRHTLGVIFHDAE